VLTEEAAGQRRGVLPDTRRCTACLQELSKSHFSHTQLQKGLSRLKCKACTSAAHTQGIERDRADSAGTGWPGAYRGIDDIYRSVVPDGYSDRSLPVRACAPARWSILAHAHVSAQGAVRRSHRMRVSHEPLHAAQAAATSCAEHAPTRAAGPRPRRGGGVVRGGRAAQGAAGGRAARGGGQAGARAAEGAVRCCATRRRRGGRASATCESRGRGGTQGVLRESRDAQGLLKG
jgi:hypothetical protein